MTLRIPQSKMEMPIAWWSDLYANPIPEEFAMVKAAI